MKGGKLQRSKKKGSENPQELLPLHLLNFQKRDFSSVNYVKSVIFESGEESSRKQAGLENQSLLCTLYVCVSIAAVPC